ncbi:CHASE domain-containing protein [Peredibacter sp. HCB2-198]|uniref:CHASE domain-containing protein n=1 Tax=Peredibacter sp. HCB2-198 TaxID=3383025 RepID=UPI0038B42105
MNKFESQHSSLTYKGLVCLSITALYFMLGWSGIQLATINANSSPIWTASGLAIGAMILFGRWVAPAIFLGAFLTNLMVGTSTIGLFTISTGNMLEAIVGSQLILWISKKNFLKNYSEFFSISIGAVFGSMVSATFGVVSLYYFGTIPSSEVSYTWYTWWSGDSIGILLVLPLFMELYSKKLDPYNISWKKFTLGVLICLFMLFITYLVFVKGFNQAFSWALCPFFILIGLTLGRLVSRTILIVIAFAIVVLTTVGFGPFEYGSLNQNLIYSQSLLFSYAFSILFVRPFKTNFTVGPKFILGNLIGWFSLFIITYMVSNAERRQLKTDFNRMVETALDSVISTTNQYDLLLSSSKAIFLLKPEITATEWKEYIHSMQIGSRYDAINGLSVIRQVPKKDLEKFKEEMARKGRPNFQVKTINSEYAEQFDDYLLIAYLEPEESNHGAIGLDVGSDKNRRETAWKAKRLNETISTDPIYLVQDKLHRIGFTIVQPIQDKSGNFMGWVGAPIISTVFFSKALKPFSQVLRTKIKVKGQLIHIEDPDSAEHPFKQSEYTIKKTVNIYGLPHVFEFYPRAPFFIRNTGTAVALALLMNLFMLFIVSFLLEQITFGQKAEALVNERTKELEVSKMQLIHSSKMASLGEMASGMAHEINNPLTIILGKIQVITLMLEELEIHHPSIFEEINKIKTTTDRIGKIVKGLRTFSRGSYNDPFEFVPLERVVTETLDLCAEKFRATGIELKIEDIPPVSIICRPSQISQVLLNLFNNAYDAIEGLEEKWIQLSFEVIKDNRILIIVTDSGHGIPSEVAEKIMEPFFTTKDVRRGTGLGLSIAKGIIEAHGGNIWLDMENTRTRFIIELKTRES